MIKIFLKQNQVDKILIKGLKFLDKAQQADGSFLSLTSPYVDFSKQVKKHNPVFFTSLILDCLNSLEESQGLLKEEPPNLNTLLLNKIKKKSAGFLLKQKTSYWTFNYWAKHEPSRKKTPFPDDLDDTFCSLAALFHYDSSWLTGEVWAKITQVLMACEQKQGGPYYTWLVEKNKKNKVWLDFDLAVNANISYFLNLQDVELPGLKKFLDKEIKNKNISSQYYATPYPVIYFLSRSGLSDRTKKILIKHALQKVNKDLSPLDNALILSALLNLGYQGPQLQFLVNNILRQVEKFGFPTCAFGVEKIVKKKKFYSGSKSLTAAFVIEALYKFLKFERRGIQKSPSAASLKGEGAEEKYFDQVMHKVNKRFSNFPKDIQLYIQKQLKDIINVDQGVYTHKIILLPYLFYKSLNQKYQKKIKKDFLIKLSQANLYGWVAYSIYDDLYDSQVLEADNSSLKELEDVRKALPIANICLRELVGIFNSILPQNQYFPAFFNQVMDQLDYENFWEVSTARLTIRKNVIAIPSRLPGLGRNYEKLYEKSLGHALGPLAILFNSGFTKSSPAVKNTLAFFQHYIIVRQLNDDAHDWEEDLANGLITSAVRMLLKDYQQKRKKNRIDLKKDLDSLRSLFWTTTIVKLCDDILIQCQEAQRSLRKIRFLSNKKAFGNMVERFEDSAHKALKERENILKFLNGY